MSESTEAEACARRAGSSCYERVGFRILLGLMVPFFFTTPLEGLSWGPVVVATVLTAVLAAAALAVYRSWQKMVVAAVLAAVWLLGVWSRVFWSEGLFEVPGAVAGVLLFSSFTVLALRTVLAHRHVTVDAIVGSVCAYVLIGMTFGLGYALVEEVTPNSLAIAGVPYAEVSLVAPFLDRRLYYFSFVTITTLGYGDITPVAPLAQSLAIVEAICGVFYMAVLVARLVSNYISQDGP